MLQQGAQGDAGRTLKIAVCGVQEPFRAKLVINQFMRAVVDAFHLRHTETDGEQEQHDQEAETQA
ncbi:MAG: hypothetical protein B7X42_08445 [Thiomonas sp. 14-66-4]|nr:MAG: hypothetical protein B7X42_08445 [Thiomonas sp. 14-66-4]